MRIFFISLIVGLFSVVTIAQDNINNYKYIVIPEQYSFTDGKDKYQLNSLTHFLFNKYGFKAVMGKINYPLDLIQNPCKGLTVDLIKNSTLFRTKLVIALKDCRDRIVYTSAEGQSKSKEYKKAYHEALREAFEDVRTINYNYVGDKEEVVKPQNQDVVVQEQSNTSLPKKKEVVKTQELNFTMGEQRIKFVAQSYGYEIFKVKEGKEVSLGKAIKSEDLAGYRIEAKELSGLGHFDAYNNFILERINPLSNKKIKDTLIRQ